MPGFTSWGKWEQARLMIKQSLLSDADLKCDEASVDTFLLETVNAIMLADTNQYFQNNMEAWQANPRQFTLDSYSSCLGVVVKAITEEYALSDEQRRYYVMPAVETAQQIAHALIDSIIAIGTFSYTIKNDLLQDVYGQDFKARFPRLIKDIYVYDVELNKQIKEALREKINVFAESETEENQKILRLHATYISEVIQQQNTNLDFEEIFKQETGQSPSEYKAGVSLKRMSTASSSSAASSSSSLSL